MAFWVGWLLWEKLSVVLGMLVVLVFIYALGVLGVKKWKMRKYAAAEEKQREAEAEMHPMLHKDDIPFGARALQRGIEVEGIWNSNPTTPILSPRQSATPVASRTASLTSNTMPKKSETTKFGAETQSPMISPRPVLPAARRGTMPGPDLAAAGFVYETPRPGGLLNRASLTISPNRLPSPTPISPAREEALVGVKDPIASERRMSFHTRISTPGQHLEAEDYRSGLDDVNDDPDYVAATMGITSHSSPEAKRASRFTKILRRRSSEEFRRRMSQIFNDNIQVGLPANQLEFNPDLGEYHRRDSRNSLLRPFRPWLNSSPRESQGVNDL